MIKLLGMQRMFWFAVQAKTSLSLRHSRMIGNSGGHYFLVWVMAALGQVLLFA
jgi:hypothetical protein